MNNVRNIFVILLTALLLQDSHSQKFSGIRETTFLENHRFIPKLGECYQLYTINETKASCRRQPDLKNQACIEWVSNNHTSLGLTTPTNETVLLRRTSQIESKTCYKIYDIEQNVSIICQQIYESHAIGLTTPDNFTIIFLNDLCKTTTNLSERMVYSNFANNFSLDVDARSCYKVYGQEEVVSPYNCLSRTIKHACVKNMVGCTSLTTENNEVLILDCLDDDQRKPKQKNCFYLYDSDNQLHTVCQEKVEERCIGVVTPSNLTVLFECFFCSEFNKPIYYNQERQREHRKFVKNYLADEYLGRHLHYVNSCYKVSNGNSEQIIYPYWIPKTSCFGLTLESKETIILNCMLQNENQEQPGCFSLITKDNDKQSICTEVLNEECVGLKTPKNLSVALACYILDSEDIWVERLYFFFQTFHNFKINNYEMYFPDGFRYEAYKNGETKTYQVQTVKSQPNCTRLESESEILLLNCDMEIKKNGCFNVLEKTQSNNGAGSISTNQVGETCVKVLNSTCVGIVTPQNWTLPLVCFVTSWLAEYYILNDFYNLESAKSAIGNIPYNEPPRY